MKLPTLRLLRGGGPTVRERLAAILHRTRRDLKGLIKECLQTGDFESAEYLMKSRDELGRIELEMKLRAAARGEDFRDITPPEDGGKV